MGTINFGTLTNKSRFALVNIVEADEEDENIYNDYYSFDYEEIKAELGKHRFYYFNLFVDFGYYDGFYLRIAEENTKYIYQNSKEKAEAVKELTQIKKILTNFVKDGFLKGCYPGWVTTYTTQSQTVKELNSIIKELKEEIKESYTEATATRQNKGIFEIIREYEEREKTKKLKAQ